MQESTQVSSGVQELIERLRDEGVRSGRQEAERLLADARREADEIVSGARAEAEGMLAEARATVARERAAAEESLKLAARDTRLDLRARLEARFTSELKRLAAAELGDSDLLRQLLLALAGRTGRELEGEALRISLPEHLFERGGQRGGQPESDAAQDLFERLTLELSSSLLREGVEIAPGEQQAGLRVRIEGREVEIDFTEEAVSRLLAEHLLPRFRHLLAGTG